MMKALPLRVWLILGGCFALLLLLIAWRSFAVSSQRERPPPLVMAARVAVRDMAVLEPATATVQSVASVNVTARVGGQIVAVGFREGQMVRRGDLLFRLDPRPYHAALVQAEAQRQRVRATAESARKDADRAQALAGSGAISRQGLESAMATAKAAEASVAADAAAVETARLNLSYAEIRSPIDGKTGAIEVQIGNMVVANASATLVNITQVEPVKLSFFLSQDRLDAVQRQMRQGRLRIQYTAGGRAAAAEVDFVGNRVDERTGTIELRAQVANRDHLLVPGQMMAVHVALGDLKAALCVPHDAINLGPEGAYVLMIDEASRARMIPVEVRFDDGTTAAIAGKVKKGDRVIVEGQLRVVPDGAVRVAGGKRGAKASGAQRR